MALFSILYADHSDLNQSGRPFNCEKCLKDPQTKGHRESIAKLRRCYEDRWDFTEKDGAVFPIQIVNGGPSFGFCPAKVMRDEPKTVMIYKILISILETGTWPDEGGIYDQEYFWIDLVSNFAPLKKTLEFNEKFSVVAKSFDGGSKNQMPKLNRRR